MEQFGHVTFSVFVIVICALNPRCLSLNYFYFFSEITNSSLSPIYK